MHGLIVLTGHLDSQMFLAFPEDRFSCEGEYDVIVQYFWGTQRDNNSSSTSNRYSPTPPLQGQAMSKLFWFPTFVVKQVICKHNKIKSEFYLSMKLFPKIGKQQQSSLFYQLRVLLIVWSHFSHNITVHQESWKH